MKNATRHIAFLLSIATIFVALVGYVAYEKVRSINVRAANEVARWQEDQDRKDQLDILEHKVESLQKSDATLQTLFLTEDSTVEFFDTIESLGTALHATTSISNLKKINAGSIGSTTIEQVSMSLTVEGDWRSVYNYLTLIEQLPYASRIDSFNVDLVAKTSALQTKTKIAPRWIANIGLSVFKYK